MWYDQPHYVFWMGGGLILAILEMVVPGVYLFWLGIAALITGVAALVLPIHLPVELVLFTILSISIIYASRRWTRSEAIPTNDPLLNDRTGRMMGEVLTLVSPIENGQGRARVGDGEWTVTGPDLPSGTHVRVVGAQGIVLRIERA